MHFTIFNHKKLLLLIYLFLCLLIGIIIGLIKSHDKKMVSNTDIKSSQEIAINSESKEIPIPPSNLDENLEYSSTQVSAGSKHLSMLFLGYGGAGHDGGYLSDAMILAYLDVDKKKLALIHIPRDIWVNVKVGETEMPMKINAALAMGTKTSNYPTTTVSKDAVLRASTLSKQAVTTVTGLPVDFVLGVDFNGFAPAIDSLGGIDINLKSTFDDSWYPVKGRELELCGHSPEEVTAMSATMSGFTLEKQFPCRYEQLHFEAGSNHMDGQTVLKYSRSRHSSSDFARGLRQVNVILATINKLFSLKALDNIQKFYTSISKSVKTDISVDQITTITPILFTIPDVQVVEIGLDTTNVLTESKASSGAFILISKEGDNNWEGVKSFVKSKI